MLGSVFGYCRRVRVPRALLAVHAVVKMPARSGRRGCRALAVFFALTFFGPVTAGSADFQPYPSGPPSPDTRSWLPLEADGIHDPSNPHLKELQQPADGLSLLPPDFAGNLVHWPTAIEKGYIDPRSTFSPDTKVVNFLDLDVMRKNTSIMPMVKFPHNKHTMWLDCANCHEHLFKSKAGATKLNMWLILNGEKCGLCHGAVAFPVTECFRCHSVRRERSTYITDDR